MKTFKTHNLFERIFCFWFGHTYGSIQAARSIVDEHGMQVGLASHLKCETCGHKKSVVTWCKEPMPRTCWECGNEEGKCRYRDERQYTYCDACWGKE